MKSYKIVHIIPLSVGTNHCFCRDTLLIMCFKFVDDMSTKNTNCTSISRDTHLKRYVFLLQRAESTTSPLIFVIFHNINLIKEKGLVSFSEKRNVKNSQRASKGLKGLHLHFKLPNQSIIICMRDQAMFLH